MLDSTRSTLRAAQMDLYNVHAHVSEPMGGTDGPSTEDWQQLYSIMQAVGALTDVIGVYLGDHAPKITPTDPTAQAFTPPF